ncbi:MAG: hypothetical protein UX53_C0013G0021, partial [Candidatus Azambacteria bacterium GW2011_GWB2_46_37]
RGEEEIEEVAVNLWIVFFAKS